MAVLRKKRNVILTAILVVVIALGAVGIISLFKRVDTLETTEKVSWTQYARGLLDDETGKLPTNSEDIDYSGIRLKNYINADGLKCELAKDAKIKYQINYFDENHDFISVTSRLSEDYDGTNNPEGAVYALIEIIPTADADGVVSTLEISSYAKQLTVTYNK